VRAAERYGAQFARAHVELPRQLLQACAEAGVHKLLHMSALGAAIDAPSEYLRSKGEAEALLTAAAEDASSNLQLCLFRPSVITAKMINFSIYSITCRDFCRCSR
jgi:NADH dehydrogenase